MILVPFVPRLRALGRWLPTTLVRRRRGEVVGSEDGALVVELTGGKVERIDRSSAIFSGRAAPAPGDPIWIRATELSSVVTTTDAAPYRAQRFLRNVAIQTNADRSAARRGLIAIAMDLLALSVAALPWTYVIGRGDWALTN
jgi:hypothetical protein